MTVQTLLDTLRLDSSWRQPNHFCERAERFDQLERLLLLGKLAAGSAIYAEVEAIMAEMSAIDNGLYRSIRDDIRQGRGATRLLEQVRQSTPPSPQQEYDPLDTLVSGVLSLDEPGAASSVLEPDMVFYQPTPARHIFDFIERAAIEPGDVVMDLGSGLGHVTLLTAICAGARCVGVEREAAYVACALRSAQALRVACASFLQQDVRVTDLSTGTVFYLYTPFTGAILRTVLDMLKREAGKRELRIGTLGPCSDIVAQESWLKADDACPPQRIALFRSC